MFLLKVIVTCVETISYTKIIYKIIVKFYLLTQYLVVKIIKVPLNIVKWIVPIVIIKILK